MPCRVTIFTKKTPPKAGGQISEFSYFQNLKKALNSA